ICTTSTKLSTAILDLFWSRAKRLKTRPCLQVPDSHVAELHESGKALSLAAVWPLKADRPRFLPRRLSRVRRVVRPVAYLRPVQGDLKTRPLEGYLDMVPILLLAEIRELLVARV